MISSLPSRPRLNLNPIRNLDPHYWSRPRGMGGIGAASSSSPFVSAMASAIAKQEGYGSPNSACTSINNPGCLRAGPGQTGTSAQGFAIFPDPTTGWNALDSQIQYNINLGLNMQGFFAGQPGVYPGYAPSADSNNPAAYAQNVASWTGVNDVSTPLSQLQASYDAGGPGVPVQPATPPVTYGGVDTVDSGALSGATDYLPYLAAAAVLLLALKVH